MASVVGGIANLSRDYMPAEGPRWVSDGNGSVPINDAARTAEWEGANPAFAPNPSGIAPVEFKVLIEPKEQAEKIGSIIVPEEAKEKGKWAEIEGRIVAVSPLAFTYSTAEEWGGQKPKPGDRIIIAKYSGVRVKGADGKEYLLTNDKDVCAVRRD